VLRGWRSLDLVRAPADKSVNSRRFSQAAFHMLRGAGDSQIAFLTIAGLVPRFTGREFARIASFCLGLLFVVATPAWPQGITFTTFDAPGAGTGAYEGTLAISINTAGTIAGMYSDGGKVAHGFVRATNGTITTFSAPGAGTGHTQGTFPFNINTGGDIAGYYSDVNSVYHGFVRAASGAITEFNAPGAGMGGHAGTIAVSINTAGTVAGMYRDTGLVYHGFVRVASGGISEFSAPGAGTGLYQGTEPISINTAGTIAGYYSDANSSYHGFVRAASGGIATFNAPGAGTGSGQGTVAVSVNTGGTIAGVYEDASGVGHGFVRSAGGTITTFDAPGAGMYGWQASLGLKSKGPPTQGTGAFNINDAGDITGIYADPGGVLHGFVRAANGVITSFDAPGAGTGFLQGTGGFSIDAAGNISGGYLDPSNVAHGFIAMGAAAPALQFFAVTPCRLEDTRPQYGGGGPILGGTFETFNLPQLAQTKGCADLSSAAAYSLNVAVVPQGPLGYLTIWPTGETRPGVATLNSLDGRIKANAAIVPAGTQGAVSVYVTQTTNVIIDIDGYFAAASSSSLAFYPLTPCRIADTRKSSFGTEFGPPHLFAKVERDFPVLMSECNIPSTALAYSLNLTAVPYPSLGYPLGYLEVWPKGQMPANPVSTLNNLTGTVVANAALVPAGTGGDITVYPSNDTDLVIDVNGYFAQAGPGGLSLYPATPCRVIDTRKIGSGQPFTGLLNPPVNVEGSVCDPPSTAQAYVFNATVVPTGALGYLTLWQNDPMHQPVVSTLNALDGWITNNMAIVPTSDGKIDAYASGITQLILDISSYFAP
jgi:hypothetical protein